MQTDVLECENLLGQAAWLILRLCARTAPDDPLREIALGWLLRNEPAFRGGELLESVRKVEKRTVA
jgi:hypothetical protein